MRVVLLDNRDSFVYNLVDHFASLGAGIEVYRSTAAASTVMAALAPTAAERAAGQRPVLCLSPGPGHPRTSGCLMELVEAALVSAVPTLGICLGFQAIVEACGGSVGPVGPVHGRSVPDPVTGDWTAASGYEAGLRLADDPTCTAVFCANDEMALGLIRALGEKGLAVPQDVSVVGFDDIPLAETFIPPLTTVHQDFAGLGRACVTKLLTLIEMGDDEVGVDLVPTHLVVRGSTAPPPENRPLPS